MFNVLLLAGAVLVASVACGEDEPEGTTTATAASANAVPGDLENVIATVQAGDAQSVRKLIAFQDLKCTKELGAGGPPKCKAEESSNNTVRVFQFIGCEPEWRRDDGVDAAIAELIAIKQPVRHSAFVPPATGYLLSGHQYVALLEGPDPRGAQPTARRGVAIAVDKGQITSIWLACGAGAGAKSQLPSGQSSFIIAPKP